MEVKTIDIVTDYDKLIDDNNDPSRYYQPLKEYMDKWDRQLFIYSMHLVIKVLCFY